MLHAAETGLIWGNAGFFNYILLKTSFFRLEVIVRRAIENSKLDGFFFGLDFILAYFNSSHPIIFWEMIPFLNFRRHEKVRINFFSSLSRKIKIYWFMHLYWILTRISLNNGFTFHSFQLFFLRSKSKWEKAIFTRIACKMERKKYEHFFSTGGNYYSEQPKEEKWQRETLSLKNFYKEKR